jgi:parallel beta-helix repeat protein
MSVRRLTVVGVLVIPVLVAAAISGAVAVGADPVDELHYSLTGPTSVTFDWRGDASEIRYGKTTAYGDTATARTPDPRPFSSTGPFKEVELSGLDPGTTYHYSIGGGTDHIFNTAPTGNFRFDVEGDIGSSRDYSTVATSQNQIGGDNPAFVLMLGDLTYGEPFGQASVDQHFNDVMAWSQQAAYMSAWGNHEWENPSSDDLRNYKGRLAVPHPQTSPSAPAPGCCGEDWGWFDAGGVRFISYPEPYSNSTWSSWQAQVEPVLADAQADSSIHFIVTFGHRPAYSTGFYAGETALAGVLNTLGDRYSKYVLNLNGHSHDYERFEPIHGVTHITAGGGGASLEPPWSSTDSRSVFRAMHLEHLRIDVSASGMRIEAVCGPPTIKDDISCVQGSVIESYTIGTNPPPATPPTPTLYVNRGSSNCSDSGSGSATQPFCSIKPAASRVVAGQTVLVFAGTYNEGVTVSSSGTASAPINFAAAPGNTVTITGGSGGASSGFTISGRSYVNVQGFNMTGTSADGIVVKNSSNITIRGNHVSYAGQPAQGKTAKGIRLDGAIDSVVSTNTSDHNSDHGIYLVNSSTRNQIVGNKLFANARVIDRSATGIRLYSSPANTISSNVSHDNEDSGIELYTGANNNLVVDNVLYNNGDHGIDDYSVTGQRVVSNTVYNNLTAGINFEGNSTGGSIANNISVDNGINSPRTRGNIRVDSTSTSGATLDYDLVNLRTSGTMFVWGNSSYSTLVAFVSATGKETHGIQADPLWEAPASGNFDLTSRSPAIDSANSAASGQPSSDADESPRLDDPDSSNTGVGPRQYDDRGAYEFEPDEPTDAPPNIRLSVTPTSGPAPLRVSADASGSTDADTTPIASYEFDFDDGTVKGPQAGPSADHTYTASGTYRVRVTVTDTAGLASSSTVQVIAGDAPPTAALTVTPSSGNAPLQVSADASGSTDTDATPIDSYTFDFGDGTVVGPRAGATAGHTYTAAGTYTVRATVTDTAGLSSSATTQVSVNAAPDAPPNAALTVTPSSGSAPLPVSADAGQSSDTDATPIATYRFDFGDGTVTDPQTVATSDHTYVLPGTYTVTVTVTDTAGLSSTATSDVTITAGDSPPSAALTVSPGSGTAPVQVVADASASTDTDATPISSYRFDFGDGTVAGPQAGATAIHTYTATGTYTVRATVTDSAGLSSSATRQVTVSAPDLPPSAALTVTPTSGTVPLSVTADASASSDTDATPIASYRFAFGDGAVVGPQTGSTATHRYTVTGTYTVTVTVTDTAGKSSTRSAQVSALGNFVGNPGFETDLSGWNTSGSGSNISLTRVAGGHSGSWAAKAANTGTTASTCLLNDSPNWVSTTSAGTYTGSLWVRGDTAGATLKLRFREYSGNTLVGSPTTQVALTTSWQPVSVSYTTGSPGSTLDFNAYVSSAAPGTCFYIDDAAISLG